VHTHTGLPRVLVGHVGLDSLRGRSPVLLPAWVTHGAGRLMCCVTCAAFTAERISFLTYLLLGAWAVVFYRLLGCQRCCHAAAAVDADAAGASAGALHLVLARRVIVPLAADGVVVWACSTTALVRRHPALSALHHSVGYMQLLLRRTWSMHNAALGFPKGVQGPHRGQADRANTLTNPPELW
jgi:hypothetical protein